MACCGRPADPVKITVTFRDGTVKTYATRVDAMTAVTRAGGGVIRGA